MRRVEYRKPVFVPAKQEEGKPWVGAHFVDDIGEGLFHCWGSDFEELSGGTANFSIAIIELDDGTVINCPSDRIKFLDKP